MQRRPPLPTCPRTGSWYYEYSNPKSPRQRIDRAKVFEEAGVPLEAMPEGARPATPPAAAQPAQD